MNEFLSLIISDMVQAKVIEKLERMGALKLVLKFFLSRTVRVIVLVRLSQTSSKFASIFARMLLRRRFIEVGKVGLGSGFFFPHPQSIIIAGGVEIGNHVHVGQYVTIGGSFKKIKILKNGEIQKLPIIGDRVMIHPGAVIGGPVTIGDDVIIGANSVVTKDVPSNSIVYGQNQLANKKIVIPDEGGAFTVVEN
ncbi:MAG: hypothetical protein HRU20_03110 [Pseudomonadales bacterium]|nr:hypothetical protein [Pseudomonadales bacterium]